jgi:hypothetical protein
LAWKPERWGASTTTQGNSLSQKSREWRCIVKYLMPKAFSLKSYRSAADLNR